MRNFDTFSSIVQDQSRLYPNMQPADYIKLAFQSEFGAEHLLDDEVSTLQYLREEWTSSPHPQHSIDRIGSEICRFWLTQSSSPQEASALLNRIFFLFSQKKSGSDAGMEEKLGILEKLQLPGMQDAIDQYRAHPHHSVHHSPVFKEAYLPHYRIIPTSAGLSFDFLLEVQRLLDKADKPVVVAVDGNCASGKTSYAGFLQSLFGGAVLHMDDYYLPAKKRPEGWKSSPAGNMDLKRVLDELLLPAKQGNALTYAPFSCERQQLEKPVWIPQSHLYILEGSYSLHPSLRPQIDLSVWLTSSRECQLERLKVREDNDIDDFVSTWIPLEENYDALCKSSSYADWVLDTSLCF